MNVNLSGTLLFECGLLKYFSSCLTSKDYKKQLSIRKDIYPFIHNLTAFIMNMFSQGGEKAIKITERIEKECAEEWQVLTKALQDCELVFAVQWG